MDFHSHLANTEIIGFLGGQWDPIARVITIEGVYPTASISTGHGSIEVEMDPVSELEVRELMKLDGRRVVGWYHSHPQFEPDPSLRDIANQTNYQLLFHDSPRPQNEADTETCCNMVTSEGGLEDEDEDVLEPFIGVIVGTYDIRMPTAVSVVNWFHVRKGGVPMFIEHTVIDDNAISDAVEKQLFALIDVFGKETKARYNRVDFSEIWRYCPVGNNNNNKGKEGEGGDKKDGAGGAAEPQLWECRKCTFVNPVRLVKCRMCKAAKPKPKQVAAAQSQRKTRQTRRTKSDETTQEPLPQPPQPQQPQPQPQLVPQPQVVPVKEEEEWEIVADAPAPVLPHNPEGQEGQKEEQRQEQPSLEPPKEKEDKKEKEIAQEERNKEQEGEKEKEKEKPVEEGKKQVVSAVGNGNGNGSTNNNVGARDVPVLAGFQPMSRFEKFITSLEGRLPTSLRNAPEEGTAFLARLMTRLADSWGQPPEQLFGEFWSRRFGASVLQKTAEQRTDDAAATSAPAPLDAVGVGML